MSSQFGSSGSLKTDLHAHASMHIAQVSKRGLHDVFYRQKHPKYEQLKHCVGKTKTNHIVLQTLSTTFQFICAFWIIVHLREDAESEWYVPTL